jgi:hypothetical protein
MRAEEGVLIVDYVYQTKKWVVEESVRVVSAVRYESLCPYV